MDQNQLPTSGSRQQANEKRKDRETVQTEQPSNSADNKQHYLVEDSRVLQTFKYMKVSGGQPVAGRPPTSALAYSENTDSVPSELTSTSEPGYRVRELSLDQLKKELVLISEDGPPILKAGLALKEEMYVDNNENKKKTLTFTYRNIKYGKIILDIVANY